MKKSIGVLFSLSFFLFSLENISAQKFIASFKSTTIYIGGGSDKLSDTTLHVIIQNAKSLSGGRIKVLLDKTLSTADSTKIKGPLSNEFLIGSEDSMNISYRVTFPRDSKDDKAISFYLKAYDNKGVLFPLSNVDTTSIIYIKPRVADSLTTNNTWETWFMTGTNFDPFNGVKPQEFFFRANTVFKIAKNFYGQIAFYKNRYFSSDSTSNLTVLQPNSPNQIINGTDTSYSYLGGTYQSNTTQKIDPVGVQFDILHKLTNDDIKGNSNFFVSCGFDISTKYTTIEQKYSNFDTASFTTKLPMGRNSAASLPKSNISFSYQKPVSNFNVGFMWILDTEDANIKAQLNAGISNFWEPTLFLNPRGGGGPTISYYNIYTKPYFQVRMFTTSKKYGLSLGFESFVRKLEFPQFNFTLSKLFDLKNFLAILTPVTSLSTNK